MLLRELMSPSLLEKMLHEHYVRVADNGDLHILCYTASTQYARVWNDVTRNCRGLCVKGDGDLADMTVVSRGIPKFFASEGDVAITEDGNANVPLTDDDENVKQTIEFTVRPEDRVHCADKLDGAMCVGYICDGYLKVHTKGAFSSPEANIGNKLLEQKYEPYKLAKALEATHPNQTPIFEVVTPKFAHVIDYGNLEDLFLLGYVDIDSGMWHPVTATDTIAEEFGFPMPETVFDGTFSEMTKLPERAGREGIVATVDTIDGRKLLKIKYEPFLQLQRLAHSRMADPQPALIWLLEHSVAWSKPPKETRQLAECTTYRLQEILGLDSPPEDMAQTKRLAQPMLDIAESLACNLIDDVNKNITTIQLAWGYANAKKIENPRLTKDKAFVNAVLSADFDKKARSLAFATKRAYVELGNGEREVKDVYDELVHTAVMSVVKNHVADIRAARGLSAD